LQLAAAASVAAVLSLATAVALPAGRKQALVCFEVTEPELKQVPVKRLCQAATGFKLVSSVFKYYVMCNLELNSGSIATHKTNFKR
jgi:hypothetical protein